MERPPFNFNTASSTSGSKQPAPGAFGSALPKQTFGASLFGKPSLLAAAAKKESEKPAEKNEPGPSSSLASRLTIPSRGKEFSFKGKGDISDSNFPQENQFKKSAFAKFPKRKLREGAPEENGPKTQRNPFDSKPIRPGLQAPIFSVIGKKEPEAKSLFGKPISDQEGVDETDYAVKTDLPVSMFGIPLSTSSSSLKSIGSMPSFPPAPALKAFGDKLWKPSKPKRESPGPESRLPKPSGSDESKLIQKLASLTGQVCPGDYEKYVLLDERDKILCQLREIDSALIRRLERCQEMCTEKERYQRIVQKGVSPFECDESEMVSHEMMVKQYARSAADQERPLPHELRSEKIMNYTMCYLLHNILDEFPDSVEKRTAWYMFLWSRTRALRKEVTQLSMSDTMALNLVERCTRLHILFGYVLCDLETEHFDAAMNNETLGKCLQTLRHFYEDFSKRGIPCENEPEFRSYDVMLHMNDTNVLSQVLSYRSEVRQSQPVRLALQLAASFRDKNFCRFFRLLKKEATFLQCCVSHKLFAVTRSNAILIMTNAYNRSMFPLEKLRDTLAFDSIDDLIVMLNLYGLHTESGSDQVMLNKDFLSLNEISPLQPYQWINDKNTGKMSQVVYGGDLYQFFASQCDVSNSFNYRNEYAHDKVLEAVLDGSNIPLLTEPATFSFTQSAGSLSMQASIEQKRKMEAERIKRQEETKKEQLIQKLMDGVVDSVFLGIAEEETMKWKMVRKKMKAMEDARRMREEAERKMLEKERKRKDQEEELARKLAKKIEKEAAEWRLERIVQQQIDVERAKREKVLAEKLTEKFWKEMLKTVDHHVLSICEELVDEKETVMEGLETFRGRMSNQWLRQFWDRWREWVQIKKEAKRRRLEMVQKCIPRWESEEVGQDLVRRYVMTADSRIKSILNHPADSIQLTVFKRNRLDRIAQRTIGQWRRFTKERKRRKRLAVEQQRRENEFFRRFEHSEKIETRFKFEEPEDWMRAKRTKKKGSSERRPLKESQSFSSFLTENSLIVARKQLEDWEPDIEIPSELKEKLKRKRESFEKICQNHSLKKKKDGEELSSQAKTNTEHLDKVSGAADELLDETVRYTADLDRMMDELKARRVNDLWEKEKHAQDSGTFSVRFGRQRILAVFKWRDDYGQTSFQCDVIFEPHGFRRRSDHSHPADYAAEHKNNWKDWKDDDDFCDH
ncbi:unnamed protein product [Caenorhabditis sp. 36 PRJEB53466]|nr:unnamed protein product [Caenorhabditis sp. 36 PRJEB53466]